MVNDSWTYYKHEGHIKPVIACIINGKKMLEGEATMFLIEEKGFTYEQAVKYISDLKHN